METQLETTQEFALENIITTAVQVPGIRVNRNAFLSEVFANEDIDLPNILAEGPVQAGCSREMLSRLSSKLILKRTSESSLTSFLTGIPGGIAMAATLPADVLQFFGMTFRLAQELSYLYGAQDLWQSGEIDNERVQNQLIMYCGVMFGVTGAASGVRILSAQVAKTALKRLPQKALTKTFWFPLIKQIGKAIGIKVTKSTVAQGISKVIPIVGGVISGSLNFASMLPMAKRLHETLDTACFGYTEAEIESDIKTIAHIDENHIDPSSASQQEFKSITFGPVKKKISESAKNVRAGLAEVFTKHEKSGDTNTLPTTSQKDILASIEQLSKLRDMGAITREEFEDKKKELLARL